MVKIFADSTCDLSSELKERYSVTCVPLFIVLGDKEYRDGVDIKTEEIYAWSDANGTTPKTAAPSIETAMESFRPVIENGDEIVVFTISEKMSTTANVFRMAASELEAEDKVSVVDSMNLSTGIGLQIIEAAIMAQNGASRDEIVAHALEYRNKVRASFVVDTLTFLHRGGRCSSVAALAGTVLGLHPEIDVVDGAMVAGRKFRGKINAVTMKYVQEMKEELVKAIPDRVFITHSGVPQELEDAVREFLESLGHFKEILITSAGGVICSHCGPGTLGVLFVAEN